MSNIIKENSCLPSQRYFQYIKRLKRQPSDITMQTILLVDDQQGERQGEYRRLIQEAPFDLSYNNQIDRSMNYLTIAGSLDKGPSRNTRQSQNANRIPKEQLLALISTALRHDLARFQAQIKHQDIIQHIRAQILHEIKHSTSSEPLKAKLETPSPSKPTTQKNNSPKRSKTPHPAPKKVASCPKIPMTQTPAKASPVAKKEKKQAVRSVVPAKTKKRIQKVLEVRPAVQSKYPRVSLVESTEMPRFGLSEREKRRMRERLLVRRMREWVGQCSEGRREKRETRLV